VQIIVGLGNPGLEYSHTRHNIGFMVVDAVAAKLGIKLSEGEGEYIIGTKRVYNDSVALVKPLTYMNNSGIAVKEIVEKSNIGLNNLLVILDDFNTPLGTIRIRTKGSSGGHNGLYSIIYHLQSDEFPRLRCGIASESMPVSRNELSDFVLSPFSENERDVVETIIIGARDVVMVAVNEGIQTAIRRCNINKFN